MPAAKKEPIIVEPMKKELEIEEKSLDLESQSLEAQAASELTKPMLKALKKIAYYTAKVGLPIHEACALVDIDPDKFKKDMVEIPIIGKIMKMKELEYKKDLMYTISQKAKSGDDKLAQWLLERRYPEEFAAQKRGSGDGSNEDFFYEAIEFVRKNGDNNPLVQEVAGRAVVISRTGTKKTIGQKIDSILGNPNPQ